jgi:hypothetical protein
MLNKFKKTHKISRPVLTLTVLTVFILSLSFILYKPKARAQIFLTSGTTWTVPTDWVNSNNSIEVIGGGGGGGGGFQQSTGNGGYGGGGGGGGGYSKAVNVTFTPGAVVGINIGTAGGGGASSAAGTAGNDTYLCNDTANCATISGSAVVAGAKGGSLGAAGTAGAAGAGGTGGAAASGVGSVKFNGGTGGTGGPFSSSTGGGGGGGAGAAGPNAAGNGGATPTNDTHGNGGQGDGTSGGTGGTTSGANGNNGTEYDGSHGSGGGAAGGDGSKNSAGSPGGVGGTYGAGGGAGGGNGRAASLGGAGGNGNQGLIRITYTYETQTDYRWRLDDGNETSGSSLAAQDTTASINYGTNVRLRFTVTNKGDTTAYAYRLEYAPYSNGCGSWTTVPATATTEAFNIFNTVNYSDQAASTNVSSGPAVITDPSGYSFAAGKLVSNTSNSATVTLTAGQFTEIEYAIQANSNATSPSYCFRVTNAGTPLDEYDNYPILNINYPPSTPTIYSVVNGTTNVPRLPVYQLRSADNNGDYLKYVIEECAVNSFPCSSGAHTYDQTSSQTCWSLQDAQSSTAFLSSPTLSSSSMAYCQTPSPADILAPNTTYFWRAKAIDPGGSNIFSAYSSVATFTTSSLEIQINGGTNITGGTKIGG